MLAPICLFIYNRVSETARTVGALKNNYLASETDLYIFSDAAKDEMSISKVDAVRKYIHSTTGFKSVTIYESTKNLGLANSIIYGVTRIIELYGKVIVVEDDLVTSPNFLNFMNQSLDFYTKNGRVFSISGFSLDLSSLKDFNSDYYLGYRASSWGWGTWLDRWSPIDWEVRNYNRFKWNIKQQLRFMRGGSDLPKMLKNQIKGKIDSWAIRWCYHQFHRDMVTIFPTQSKLVSIGFGVDATHTKRTTRFNTTLDTGEQIEFNFCNDLVIEKALIFEQYKKFSIFSRLKDKFQ